MRVCVHREDYLMVSPNLEVPSTNKRSDCYLIAVRGDTTRAVINYVGLFNDGDKTMGLHALDVMDEHPLFLCVVRKNFERNSNNIGTKIETMVILSFLQ